MCDEMLPRSKSRRGALGWWVVVVTATAFVTATAASIAARAVAAQATGVIASAATVVDVARLPLVEVPAANGEGHALALLMSGDGNWASFVRHMADTLAAHGIPVVGLEARSYLDRKRTPDELARDMAHVLEHYLTTWGRDSVILIGYSRGADFVPFVLNRLPDALRERVRLAVMVGASQQVTLRFHLTDLVRDTRRSTDIPLLPEAIAMAHAGVPTVCVYGEHDRDALCPLLPPGDARVVERSGGHRDPDPAEESELILSALRSHGVPGAPAS